MTTATHGYAMRVLSSVFTIAQIDARNIEFSLLVTENKSETAIFWVRYFFRASSFQGHNFLEGASLFIL